MRVVRVKPGIHLGDHDLINHCGVGELWGDDWVGVIQIFWPYHEDHFEFVTSVNAGGRSGTQVIRVTTALPVRLESSPYWAGGSLLENAKTVCFWWRCALRKGQFEKIDATELKNPEYEGPGIWINPTPAPPSAASGGPAEP